MPQIAQMKITGFDLRDMAESLRETLPRRPAPAHRACDGGRHRGEAHLHRYLAEFDFRYNRRTALKVTDAERNDQLKLFLAMIEGKRLTYRRIGESGHA